MITLMDSRGEILVFSTDRKNECERFLQAAVNPILLEIENHDVCEDTMLEITDGLLQPLIELNRLLEQGKPIPALMAFIENVGIDRITLFEKAYVGRCFSVQSEGGEMSSPDEWNAKFFAESPYFPILWRDQTSYIFIKDKLEESPAHRAHFGGIHYV